MAAPSQVSAPKDTFDYLGQKKETQGFLSDYGNAIRGQENLSDAYSRIGQIYGVPQLQQNVTGLGNQVNSINESLFNMPSTVASTTRNSLVTEGQRQNLVNTKSQPLQTNLSRISNAYGQAQGALTAAQGYTTQHVGYLQNQQAKELMPWEKGYDAMQTMQARQFSGYTQQNQNELNALITNAQMNNSWDSAALDRAQQLAIQEQNYKLELKKMGNGNGLISVGEGTSLFDPTTGKVVYSKGKTYAPSSGSSSSGW